MGTHDRRRTTIVSPIRSNESFRQDAQPTGSATEARARMIGRGTSANSAAEARSRMVGDEAVSGSARDARARMMGKHPATEAALERAYDETTRPRATLRNDQGTAPGRAMNGYRED